MMVRRQEKKSLSFNEIVEAGRDALRLLKSNKYKVDQEQFAKSEQTVKQLQDTLIENMGVVYPKLYMNGKNVLLDLKLAQSRTRIMRGQKVKKERQVEKEMPVKKASGRSAGRMAFGN